MQPSPVPFCQTINLWGDKVKVKGQGINKTPGSKWSRWDAHNCGWVEPTLCNLCAGSGTIEQIRTITCKLTPLSFPDPPKQLLYQLHFNPQTYYFTGSSVQSRTKVAGVLLLVLVIIKYIKIVSQNSTAVKKNICF